MLQMFTNNPLTEKPLQILSRINQNSLTQKPPPYALRIDECDYAKPWIVKNISFFIEASLN